MKCVKCKFKDRNTGVCTYPFAVVAVQVVIDSSSTVANQREMQMLLFEVVQQYTTQAQ